MSEEEIKLLPPLQAIKQKCYDCSGWSWNEVRECDRLKCTLWPYRLGHHPKLKGKGNAGHFKPKAPTPVGNTADETKG